MSVDWQRAWAITPKFTGGISVLSSLALSYIIIRNPRKKNKNKSYHRILLGMSICDILASTAWFFSSWPKPKSTHETYGAIGTEATCSLQGFLAQFSIATVFYSGALSIYYLLILVQKWSKERFSKIEPFLHIIVLTWGLGTSIAGAALEIFNPSGWSCWINRKPKECVSSWRRGDDEPNCDRGNNAEYYVWIFFYAPLWIVIISVTFCMSWVYWTVLQEDKQNKANITEEQNESTDCEPIERQNESTDCEPIERQNKTKPKKNSRQIANRAGLYVGAFYLTWIMPTILEIMNLSGSNIPPVYFFLAALLIPAQGTFNLVIYTLPSFAKFRKHSYLQNQFVVLVWFKMLAVELGLVKEVEDQPDGDICNGESIQTDDQKTRLDKEPQTLSQWMIHPSSGATTS